MSAKDRPGSRRGDGDRIAALSSRFSSATDEVALTEPAPVPATRSRGRHTFYVDSALVAQLDQAYRDTAHALYPAQVSKSDFLEAMISYGLDHIEEMTGRLPSSA